MSTFLTVRKLLLVMLTGGLTACALIQCLRWLRRWRRVREKKIIYIVNTVADWENVYDRLQEQCTLLKVVGLDCEWVPGQGESRGKVALLQLSTTKHLCVLVRLCQLRDQIPVTLKQFLQDKSILKAGVGVKDDASKLFKDYGLVLRGCVDLRHLLNRVRGIYTSQTWGLKGMSKAVLGVSMEKVPSIRCGNWETLELTEQQISYAASDAIVGVDIFIHLSMAKMTGKLPTDDVLEKIYDTEFWKKAVSICQGIIDTAYTGKHQREFERESCGDAVGTVKTKSKSSERGALSATVRSYSTRQTPLYHNCKLLAPDGQLLCTCDDKKAFWYMDKGLGEKVSDSPLTVQLYFEPSGRPDSSRNYYLQDKRNICVACGASDSYIRKIVVPHEYRKYFPYMMKEHSSHDVLLLCPSCHAHSSQHDSLLRQDLAQRCGAPLDSGNGAKMRQDSELNKVKSAAKALKLNNSKLPAERKEILENIVKLHYGVTVITEHLLSKAMAMDIRIHNSSYVSHGQRVVEYIRQHKGLVSFEKMWRQHFLDTMNPQFLPLYWSVDHNHERLAQFDQLGHA